MQNREKKSGLVVVCAATVAIVLLLTAVSAAQAYPPARIRVADRGLAERQLLETLRDLVQKDPAQLATRVDLMIAAYSIVSYSESGDDKLASRIEAVEKAFETYQQSAVGPTKPTEGAMSEAFSRQLENAMANLDQQPVVQSMDQRIRALERDVANLNAQVQQMASESPATSAQKKEKVLAVGGMAATIASVLLLAR